MIRRKRDGRHITGDYLQLRMLRYFSLKVS